VDTSLRDKLLKNPEYDDYSSLYKAITVAAERQRYKKDFTEQYDEYLQLRNRTTQRLKLATDLCTALLALPEGSNDYDKLKQKLYTEYRRLKADTAYTDDRRLWMYLHRKLSHIKKRVNEYDNK